jgi:hypothetical protein
VERLCALPWEKRYGTISTVNTAAYLENVRFGLFALSDCGRRSTALVHNPTQIDQSVPHYASRITWEQVDASARFHFTWNENTDEKCSDGIGCDGLNNIMVRDMDGSLMGTTNEFATGPNPTHLFGEPTCASRFNWTGFECAPTPRIVRGLIEAVDPGRVALGGLQVTRRFDPADNTTWRTSMSFGSIKDMCAKRGEQPLYAHFLTTGIETHLYWPATEPGQIRYRLYSRDPNDAGVISLFIARPYSWSLFVNGREVPMTEAANSTHFPVPRPSDPIGTWLFSPQRRHIWFTVRGTADGAATWIDLVRKPTVQLNLHLAVTVEQFFGADLITNMAILLQIDPWRIKIVDVRPGSSMVRVEITDNQPPVVLADSNDTATIAAATAQFQRMQTIAQQVQTMAASGQLSTIGSYTVLSVAITPPVSVAVPESETAAPVQVVPSAPAQAGLSPGAIAGVVFGCLFGVLVVAGALLMYRRAARADRTSLVKARRISDEKTGAGETPVPVGVDGVEYSNPGWSRPGSVPVAPVRQASGRRTFSPMGAAAGSRTVASGARV